MLLDTLRMQRRLREAGFPDEQADVLTEEVANIVTGELATKGDLTTLRTEMLGKFAEMDDKIVEVRGEIAEVRGEFAQLRGHVAQLESRIAEFQGNMAEWKDGLIKWLVGLVAAVLLGFGAMTVAVMVTLVRVAG